MIMIIIQNEPGKDPYIILSKEEIAQGDAYGRNTYETTLTPSTHT